jgi:tetratricopeptide (TPR) repeat protein
VSTDARTLETAAALIDAGQAQTALPMLRQLLTSEPENARAMTYLAGAYRELGDLGSAVEAATGALALRPDNEYALRLLALCAADLNDRATAITAATEAQRVAPYLWRTHLVRAQVDIILGSTTDAGRHAADTALGLAPDVADVHLIAAAHAITVDGPFSSFSHRRGRQHAKRALAIDPQRSDAQALLASINMASGWGTAGAARMMLDALAADPTNRVNRLRLFQTVLGSVQVLTLVLIGMLAVELGFGRSVKSAPLAHLDAAYVMIADTAAVVALVTTVIVFVRLAVVLKRRGLRLLRSVPGISAALTLRLISIAFAFVALTIVPFLPFDVGLLVEGISIIGLVVTGLVSLRARRRLE